MNTKIGTYGSYQSAKNFVRYEEQYGMYGRFNITDRYVGMSIDPAYSDQNGYCYDVFVY